MTQKQVRDIIFEALNREENDRILTLALGEETGKKAVFIQFNDGTKYKIQIEKTEKEF